MKIKEMASGYFKTEDGILSMKDYWSYGMSGFGQNMIYGIMASYLMIFYTDIFLIPSATAGTMFLVAKLFDAFNDPIMGTIVDKTRTKWGKMRPYLLFTPIPIAIITIMLFLTPNFSLTGKIIYMYVTYILWGVIYTIGDVPFWSMSSVLTPNRQERTNLVAFTRLLTGAGMAFPVVVISALFFAKDNNIVNISNKNVYFITALICAIGGALLFFLGFFKTKEVVPQSKSIPTLKENFTYMFTNKPLMIILLSNILAFPKLIQGGAMVYVATYLMGGGQYVVILGIPIAVGGFLSFLFVSPMVKKFGLIKTYIIANIVWIFPMIATFFVNPKNIALVFFFLFISSIAAGVVGAAPTILIADCIDYSEWKTHQRSEGIAFSIQTFMAKATSAMQSWAVGILLVIFAFVQPISVNGEIVQQVQSTATQNGMWAMFTIIPALGGILSIIPLFFYDLKGEKLEKIQNDLAVRREEQIKEIMK